MNDQPVSDRRRFRRRAAAIGAGALVAIAGALGSARGADPAALVSGAEPLRLGVPGAANSGVSLAALGSSVVVTWAARAGSATDVYAAWSRDGGASFETPVRVNDAPGDARVSGEQAPRIALAGSVRVVWESSQGGNAVVRTATRPSGAAAFGAAASVHPEGLTGARGWASLAADENGAAHVAWLDGRGDAPAGAAAAASAQGARRMGHGGRQDLFQASLWPDGTRSETRIATDVCFCCKTAVAAGPDGSVYVAWRHIYKPNLRDIAVARSSDGGRTFAAPVRVSEDGWAIDACPDDGPSLAVDAKGVLHVAWPTRVSEAGKGVFYSRSTDGGRSFAPRARVDETQGGAGHPQLAVAGERVFVVWDEATAGARRALLRSVEASGAWPPRMDAAAALSTGPASYPAVAASAAATLAAWTVTDPAGSFVRVKRLER